MSPELKYQHLQDSVIGRAKTARAVPARCGCATNAPSKLARFLLFPSYLAVSYFLASPSSVMVCRTCAEVVSPKCWNTVSMRMDASLGRSLALLLFVVLSPRHNSTNESDVRDFGRSMTTTSNCVV